MESFKGKMSPELEELLAKNKIIVDAMSPEEYREMINKQRESWVRSETQWAKDFREGKCERD
jgi:hypothetical protein